MTISLSNLAAELAAEAAEVAELLRSKETIRVISRMTKSSDELLSDIAGLAAQICSVPIATVTLVDDNSQIQKGYFGLSPEFIKIDREDGICNLTIQTPEKALVIYDATLDSRVSHLPVVNGELDSIKFYTGFPLVTKDGYAIGVLCVIDHQPRELTQDQITAVKKLRNLALSVLLA